MWPALGERYEMRVGWGGGRSNSKLYETITVPTVSTVLKAYNFLFISNKNYKPLLNGFIFRYLHATHICSPDTGLTKQKWPPCRHIESELKNKLTHMLPLLSDVLECSLNVQFSMNHGSKCISIHNLRLSAVLHLRSASKVIT